MRVSQVSNNSLNMPNKQSFGAFITKRFMDAVLFGDDKFRQMSKASVPERSKLFALTSLIFKKSKEISSWDNFRTTVDIVPKETSDKTEKLYDIVLSSSKDVNGNARDGIGYAVVVKTFDAAKKGFIDAFINFSKKAYLRAKRPVIIDEAQKVLKENQDIKVLDDVQKRLGNDTFEIFKHEYFRLKKHQEFVANKAEVSGI